MGWVGHVAFNTGLRKSYKIFVQKIKNEGLRKEICRWDDDVKIEVSEIECACVGVDWNNMVQGGLLLVRNEVLLSTKCGEFVLHLSRTAACCDASAAPTLECQVLKGHK